MRILVFSDSHGDRFAVEEAAAKHRSAKIIIHLGDGERDTEGLRLQYPDKMIHQVRGNCDFGSGLPYTGEDIVGDKRIFFAHGQTYRVKRGLYEFIAAARDHKADIALFGHTHIAETFYEDGLYVMNPGSIGFSRGGGQTYGIIDITGAGVVCMIAKL